MADQRVEFGHVLFLDLADSKEVGLKEGAINAFNAQLKKRLDELNIKGEYLHNKVADGQALVFFSDPETVAELAIALSGDSRLENVKARMAIHSGPVFLMCDISLGTTVAGSGINHARRIVDKALPNQILCSESYAGILQETTRWQPLLKQVGHMEPRSGQPVAIYSLHGDGFGNDQAPQFPTGADQGALGTPHLAANRKVAILYERGVSNDEHVLDILESGLLSRGHKVYTDRSVPIGVEWADALKSAVCHADVVIPMVSMSSLNGQSFALQLELAYQTLGRPGSFPTILPVRIGYAGALPNVVGPYLEHVPALLWEDKSDDDKIVSLVNEFLSQSLPLDAGLADWTIKWPSLHPSLPEDSGGGPMPFESSFYVERKSDQDFLRLLGDRAPMILTKGSKQMGKSSLLERGLNFAEKSGWSTVKTDLATLSDEDLQTTESIAKALAVSLFENLHPSEHPDSSWSEYGSSTGNLDVYLDKVLKEVPEHLVWAIDGLDRLLASRDSSDVLALFRAWHEERQTKLSSPLKKLSQVLFYGTEAQMFIQNPTQSPFNVGISVELADLSFPELKLLNEHYGNPLSDEELSRVQTLIGGQPYLVRQCLYSVASGQMSLNAFEASAVAGDGPVQDHLKWILLWLSRAGLVDEVRLFLQRGAPPSENNFYFLRSAGIFVGSYRRPEFRSEIYRSFLKRHLAPSEALA